MTGKMLILRGKISNRSYESESTNPNDKIRNNVELCDKCKCTKQADGNELCTPCNDVKNIAGGYKKVKIKVDDMPSTWITKDKSGHILSAFQDYKDGNKDIFDTCDCCEEEEDDCDCGFCECCEECYEHDMCGCDFCECCEECIDHNNCSCWKCDNCECMVYEDEECCEQCDFCDNYIEADNGEQCKCITCKICNDVFTEDDIEDDSVGECSCMTMEYVP